MNRTFDSSGNKLAYHLATPTGRGDDFSGLILCHGFPIGPLDARRSAGTFPELVDRIAHEVGYIGMTFTFRGCGTSTGDFSLQGWTDDLRSAIDHLTSTTGVREVVLLGTNTGGSIAICVGADDPRVSAVGLLSPRADLCHWGAHPPHVAWVLLTRGSRRSGFCPPVPTSTTGPPPPAASSTTPAR